MEEEIWLPIKGYEGIYEVSNMGQVRSLERYEWNSVKKMEYQRIRKGRILIASLDSEGYKKLTLAKNDINVSRVIHKLVAKEFVPNPENKPQVNHKNGIKSDNRAENLEWVTHTEQMRHAFSTGLARIEPNVLLNHAQVREIRLRYKFEKISHRTLAKEYGVCKSTITNIVSGKSWTKVK